MRIVMLTLVISLALFVVACGSAFPKQGVINPNASAAGVGLTSQIEDDGQFCVHPPEYFMLNADGSRLGIKPGTKVEILEEAKCAKDPNRPYKVKVIGQNVVGWVARNNVVLDR